MFKFLIIFSKVRNETVDSTATPNIHTVSSMPVLTAALPEGHQASCWGLRAPALRDAGVAVRLSTIYLSICLC